ncbi:putative protein FAM47C [Haliotis rubra]|uniref:putative protein FAM47C n=1 Tax=Haliotis rubra TaxID=36100 RepID=UPI001EE5E73C|nr:putative protein FAM47C [Haliotis rubra]
MHKARGSVAMSITTEVQDEKSKPHTTTEDSASGETNVTVEDDNETAFPRTLPTTKTHNPYIIAIVMVVVAAGLLVLITTPFLLCTWHRRKPQKRSVTNVAVTERDSDHVYDEIGPPTVQPNTVAPPDIEAGYLTPTRPNTESSYLTPTMPNPYTVSIVTVPPDNGAGYLTPTKPNTDSGSIVTAPPDTEAGYLTATQPNTETRYLTLSQSNTETRYLTLAQPNTDTGSMVTALSDTGAGYFTTV